MGAMSEEVAEYICKHLYGYDEDAILTAILTVIDSGKLPELRRHGYEDSLLIWLACELEDKFLNRRSKTMKIMLDGGAYMPERAHATDAGLDLKAPLDISIPPGGSCIVDTGVHVEIPAGCVGMLKSKSGLNVYQDITSEGVIDEGYTGSIMVKLYNNNRFWHRDLKAGNKITQLVILPVVIPDEIEIVDSFEETERGDNGFGSSGR